MPSSVSTSPAVSMCVLWARLDRESSPSKAAMEKTTYTVPEGIRRLRADKALAMAFPEHSRTALQRAFDAGLVSLRGAAITRDCSVVGGDVIEFALPETTPSVLKGVDIPLDVLLEDKH